MSDKLKKLLESCLEIEGLISLMIVRDGHAISEAYELLKDKASRLKDDIELLHPQVREQQTLSPEETEIIIEKNEESCSDCCEKNDPAAHHPAPGHNDEMPDVIAAESNFDKPTTNDTAPKTTNDSISAIFSINDRFLFCRELFNSSKEEMDEALDVTSRMNSPEEIDDYFFNDLCLDPENETVRDFLTKLKSRINK